jgi:putative membrane protein
LSYVPYCGTPPDPSQLFSRWNLDPVLIAFLLFLAWLHLSRAPKASRPFAAAGWAVASFAFLSPLCALSVSLFAARVGQHMILTLIAAPLIAVALPPTRRTNLINAALFFAALWLWHMPAPYEATFRSTAVYWAMHVTLFGSAILLWRDLVGHVGDHTLDALAAGTFTSVQMGLLGALLTFASRPLFTPHLLTSETWGLSPLTDQQLGGLLMWVPGGLLFVWVAVHSMRRLWQLLDEARPT